MADIPLELEADVRIGIGSDVSPTPVNVRAGDHLLMAFVSADGGAACASIGVAAPIDNVSIVMNVFMTHLPVSRFDAVRRVTGFKVRRCRADTIKLLFRKLNSISCEQLGVR